MSVAQAEPMTADAYLDAVADRFERAAAGESIPHHVGFGLVDIVTIEQRVTLVAASAETVDRVVAALAAVLVPACAFYAGRVPADVLDLGLRSAGGLVRLFGPDSLKPSGEAIELVTDWVDAVAILINEIDTEARWRRIRVRAEARCGAVAPPSLAIH